MNDVVGLRMRLTMTLLGVGLISSAYLSAIAVSGPVGSAPFGKLRGVEGVPFVGLLAAGYFLLVVVLTRKAGTRAKPSGIWNMAGEAISLLMLLLSSYLIVRLVTEGHSDCLICWASYLPSALVALLDKGEGEAAQSSPSGGWRSLVAPIALAVLALGVYAGFVRQGIGVSVTPGVPADGDADPDEFRSWLLAQPRDAWQRIPGAPVFARFHDFQCPPCKETFLRLKDTLQQADASGIAVRDFDFPLDPECNPFVTAELHPLACELAVLSRIERKTRTAFDVDEWLYGGQEGFTREMVLRELESRGAAPGTDRYRALIEETRVDIELGRSLGVQGTPTFFLDGVKVGSGLTVENLVQALAIAKDLRP